MGHTKLWARRVENICGRQKIFFSSKNIFGNKIIIFQKLFFGNNIFCNPKNICLAAAGPPEISRYPGGPVQP